MQFPVFTDRATVDQATQLMLNYGDEAGLEAAYRAERYLADGNQAVSNKWRRIERLCVLLSLEHAVGSIH